MTEERTSVIQLLYNGRSQVASWAEAAPNVDLGAASDEDILEATVGQWHIPIEDTENYRVMRLESGNIIVVLGEPYLQCVYNEREYIDPLVVISPELDWAIASDAQVKEATAYHFEIPEEALREHLVQRPETGYVSLIEKPTFGET